MGEGKSGSETAVNGSQASSKAQEQNSSGADLSPAEQISSTTDPRPVSQGGDGEDQLDSGTSAKT